jgi:hypothetical protein
MLARHRLFRPLGHECSVAALFAVYNAYFRWFTAKAGCRFTQAPERKLAHTFTQFEERNTG